MKADWDRQFDCFEGPTLDSLRHELQPNQRQSAQGAK